MTSGRPPRVLFVTSNFPRWERDSTTPFVLHLAADLRALNWDVHVLAPHAPGALVSESLEGVPVERFRYSWPESTQTVCYQGGALLNLRRKRSNFAKLPLLVLCEWAATVKRLRGGAFDLVHSHWILPQGFTVALAALPLGVPHVTTIHGGDVFALKGRLLTACKRFALARADAVTANSSATIDAATRILPGLRSLERIPMGASDVRGKPAAIEALRSKYRRDGGPLLLFVGRLVEEKGAADLLAAVALLRTELPGLTALIAGDGPERSNLQQQAQTLGLTDRVTLTGWIEPSEIVNYYAAADIFVGPSKRAADGWAEAQGLTFVEAMLAGTSVIATRSGGIGDTIRDRETGLLVSEGAPEEIARAVVELCGDPTLAARMRETARSFATRSLTRDASARAFAALYENVLADRQTARGRRAIPNDAGTRKNRRTSPRDVD